MNKIREVVIQKGLTFTGVAKAARMSRSHFYDIMSGKKNPTLKIARRIARIIDATLDELFPVTKKSDA